MRMVRAALVALVCGLAPLQVALVPDIALAQKAPARGVPAPSATPASPDPQDAPAQSYEGGAGYLPGSQFQRKLDGGPGFTCMATNARHDQRCTASCQAGETADCVDADGGGEPSCGCTKG
jgi:hypothetical protein